MSVINTNVSAILTQNSLVKNERAMSGAMEQLSTGKRINSSADDAAGLSIASRMTAQINGLDQSVRNANDAISLVQTADGALIEVTAMLQRMRTLAVQSASDTNTSADRTALNQEFTLLRTEINRIGNNTQWNGEDVLDQSFASHTGAYSFQVGANASQTIDLQIGAYTTTGASTATTATKGTTTDADADDAQLSYVTIAGTPAVGDTIAVTVGDKSYVHTVDADDIGDTDADTIDLIAIAIKDGLVPIAGVTTSVASDVITFTADALNTPFEISASKGLLGGINSSSVLTAAKANQSIVALDTAINTVNAGRAAMGATINVLVYAVENLSNVSLNASASKSRIEDTDFATATTELAKTQIIGQAATAMLAQANQIPQTVLSLLK